MLVLLVALLMPAHAEEPEEPEERAAAEEVIVFGQIQVETARQQVIADLKAEGYTNIKKKDGRTILKNETIYRGKVVLYDDGWYEHRRQGVQGSTPDGWLKDNAPPLAWMPCVLAPHQCFRVGGVVISPRKLQHVKTDTQRAIDRDLVALSDALADLNVERTVNDLPDRLEACWELGVPLISEGELVTEQERLDEILRFLDSRTDNEWGRRVAAATEAYIRGVIQHELAPGSDMKKQIASHL